MIDHLIRYADEAAALADPMVATYRAEDGWDTSRVIPSVRVYTVIGTTTDDEGSQVEVRGYLPYWYLWIALPERREDLTCMVVADRESRTVLSSLIPPEDWHLYHCEPVIAGSDYPFGLETPQTPV